MKRNLLRRLLVVAIIAAIAAGYAFWHRPAPSHTITPPGSGLEITLTGPDQKKDYRFTVMENGKLVASRFLGPVTAEAAANPKVSDDGHGVLTIAWGEGATGASAVIDTKERKIVRDSNPDGMPNEPFWKADQHKE